MQRQTYIEMFFVEHSRIDSILSFLIVYFLFGRPKVFWRKLCLSDLCFVFDFLEDCARRKKNWGRVPTREICSEDLMLARNFVSPTFDLANVSLLAETHGIWLSKTAQLLALLSISTITCFSPFITAMTLSKQKKLILPRMSAHFSKILRKFAKQFYFRKKFLCSIGWRQYFYLRYSSSDKWDSRWLGAMKLYLFCQRLFFATVSCKCLTFLTNRFFGIPLPSFVSTFRKNYSCIHAP